MLDAVNTVPVKTADEMKRLNPLTVTVKYKDRTAIIRPRIENRPEGPCYVTTYVPNEGIAEVQFPSEITRKRTNNHTKAYEDCRSTGMKFLTGEYEKGKDLHSLQEQALFLHLAGEADAEVQIIG